MDQFHAFEGIVLISMTQGVTDISDQRDAWGYKHCDDPDWSLTIVIWYALSYKLDCYLHTTWSSIASTSSGKTHGILPVV